MKTIDEMLIGCEHDGSYIPVNEVKRLMAEYAEQQVKNCSIHSVAGRSEQFKCEKCNGSWGEVRATCFECGHESGDLSI